MKEEEHIEAGLFGELSSGAWFSDSGTYRYRLWRYWGEGTRVAWLLLNPSIASATVDDPTLGRCRSFTEREGATGFDIVNLYALRSTDPKVLRDHPDPVGPRNHDVLDDVLAGADLIIAGWGAYGDFDHARSYLASVTAPVYCLGTTLAGHPRHPLYLPKDAPLVVWEPPL